MYYDPQNVLNYWLCYYDDELGNLVSTFYTYNRYTDLLELATTISTLENATNRRDFLTRSGWRSLNELVPI